jgi:hypothetical protein
MPVSEGPQLNLPRTIVFAVGSVVLGVVLIWLVVFLAGSGDVQFKLGDDVFEVGDAARFADRIAEGVDGRPAPIPFSSLSRSRPIFVHHLGTDAATGWIAVDARAPSDPDGCALAWDSEAQEFFDQCAPDERYPADGAGLLHYAISVDGDGSLVVDLAAAGDREDSTTG